MAMCQTRCQDQVPASVSSSLTVVPTPLLGGTLPAASTSLLGVTTGLQHPADPTTMPSALSDVGAFSGPPHLLQPGTYSGAYSGAHLTLPAGHPNAYPGIFSPFHQPAPYPGSSPQMYGTHPGFSGAMVHGQPFSMGGGARGKSAAKVAQLQMQQQQAHQQQQFHYMQQQIQQQQHMIQQMMVQRSLPQKPPPNACSSSSPDHDG